MLYIRMLPIWPTWTCQTSPWPTWTTLRWSRPRSFLKILPEYFSALYSMKHGSSSSHTWNTWHLRKFVVLTGMEPLACPQPCPTAWLSSHAWQCTTISTLIQQVSISSYTNTRYITSVTNISPSFQRMLAVSAILMVNGAIWLTTHPARSFALRLITSTRPPSTLTAGLNLSRMQIQRYLYMSILLVSP